LKNSLDRQPLPQLLLMPSPVTHENLRGPGYYAAQPTRREAGAPSDRSSSLGWKEVGQC